MASPSLKDAGSSNEMNFTIAGGHGYSSQGIVSGQDDWNPPAAHRSRRHDSTPPSPILMQAYKRSGQLP